MNEIEKCYVILEGIKNNPDFDLIDYYMIESKKPTTFIKSVKGKLNASQIKTLNEFARKNDETEEWKDRHYDSFFNTNYIFKDRQLTHADKLQILGRLIDLNVGVNNRTVRVMMLRYVKELQVKENAPVLSLNK